jgi:hypothetical protein
MLETHKNSKTGEPIIPTISKLNKIATGMGMSVNDLLVKCDDMPISLAADTPTSMNLQLFNGGTTQLTEDEKKWLDLYRNATEDVREKMVFIVESIAELQSNDQQSVTKKLRDSSRRK